MVGELLDDPEVSKEKKLEAALKLTQKLIPERIIHESHDKLTYEERKELIDRLELISGTSKAIDVKVEEIEDNG